MGKKLWHSDVEMYLKKKKSGHQSEDESKHKQQSGTLELCSLHLGSRVEK